MADRHDHTCSDECAATEEHMKAMDEDAWRQIHELEKPEPPTNVVAHTHRGRDIPLDVTYVGLKDGIHQWQAEPLLPASMIRSVTMDKLPPHTAVSVMHG